MLENLSREGRGREKKGGLDSAPEIKFGFAAVRNWADEGKVLPNKGS